MKTSGFVLIIYLLFLSSCAYKKTSYNYVKKYIDTPIFIPMPENILIFNNISPVIQSFLYNYFKGLGYKVAGSGNQACTLKIKIQNLTPRNKFVSPDVLMYSEIMKLDLFCQAFDKSGNLLAEKSFSFSMLSCKPKDPVKYSGFLDFSFRKLMQRKVAPRVERYFRKYWKK